MNCFIYSNKRELGVGGEKAAVDFLKEKGYEVLERNYRTKFGEVDIIAKDKGFYCFIEVKTRQSINYGTGSEAVVKNKQRTIARVAEHFLAVNHLDDVDVRFDVVSVFVEEDNTDIEIIENAFDAD